MIPAPLAEAVDPATASTVLVGVTGLALLIAVGLVITVARLVRSKDRQDRRLEAAHQEVLRLRRTTIQPPRPRMPRPGPPPEPTVDLSHTHVLHTTGSEAT